VTEEEEWEAYVTEVGKHPNEEDEEKAREFARRVLAQPEIAAQARKREGYAKS
jgi:hypothetical protein